MEKTTAQIVSRFVVDLELAMREELRAKILQTLGGPIALEQPRRSAGRPLGAKNKAKPPKPDGKRSPEELSRQAAKIYEAVAANPGRRVEEIGEILKMKTSAMALPIKKLMAERKIRAEGTRRGTKYSAVK